MSTLICGSVAYDNIMVFKDRFKDCILPDQIHILNVCFLVPDIKRVFGGCAGNIAYNLKLLGGDPLIMATIGDDAQPYLNRLDDLSLSREHVRVVPGNFTAQAFITTDLDDNQITAFHPGAMNFSHYNSVAEAKDATLAIVAPDGRDGMLKHARDLAAKGVPFIFDPGQQLPMFSGDELLEFLDLATYACLNDYETKLLSDRTGKSLEELAAHVEALIVTLGAEGLPVALADFVSARRMTLAALVCDLDGTHHGRQRARLFPVPTVRDAIEQAGTIGVAATGRVDDGVGFDAGNLDDLSVCVNARAFSTKCDDQRVNARREFFERLPGSIAEQLGFVVVQAGVGRQTEEFEQFVAREHW